MTKIEYKKLFEECVNSGETMVLNLIYVSLISSDRVTDLESCNKSLDELQKMREALTICDIDQVVKEEWKKRIEMGLEICERDRESYLN